LLFNHTWEVIRDEGVVGGPFRVSSRSYRYHFIGADDKELLMYHWQPDSGMTLPHVHMTLPAHVTRRTHVPTGRMTIEAIVRFAIDELGATPQLGGWRERLGESERLHVTHRSWHTDPPEDLPGLA
jgi:hypothetical protein